MYWKTLSHNGPFFSNTFYTPGKQSGKIFIYERSYLVEDMTADEEQFLFILTRYVNGKYFDSQFQKNFWTSWCKLNNRPKVDIDRVHYSNIVKKFQNSSKNAREKPPEKYRFCTIDDRVEEVANFAADPPAIFVGRGKHPKRGTIKKGVLPDDVVINISKDSPAPTPSIPGSWKEIIHDNSSFWLASWIHPVTGKYTYMYPSILSQSRIDKIKQKFENARSVRKLIPKIRKRYDALINGSDDKKKNQIGIVIYFIDSLWIRVGSSKESLNNTYGISTLLRKHVAFPGKNQVRFRFPGKDSIPYDNTVKVSERIFKLIKSYHTSNSDERIFDAINSSMVNRYLQTISPGLSSKIFRTFHVSATFEKCLKSKISTITEPDKTDIKFVFFYCVSLIAQRCNHKKQSNQIAYKNKVDKLKKKIKQGKKSHKMDSYKLQLLKLGHDLNLTTSINNYIDPRIIFTYCKNYSIEISILLPTQIRNNIKWGDSEKKDWKF